MRLVLDRGTATDPPSALGATYFAISLLGDFRERREEDLEWERTLDRRVTDLGGELVLDVDSEQSVIGIDGFEADVDTYLATLAEAVLQPRHGELSFSWRRGEILDQLEELETRDEGVFLETLGRTAFGAGHPYARSAFGDARTLEKLELAPVVAHQRALLTPVGATLIVAGGLRRAQLEEAIRRHFGSWRAKPQLPRPKIPAPSPRRKSGVVLVPQPAASVMTVCAVRPFTARDGSAEAAEVLARVSADRLEGELRRARGFTYGLSYLVIRNREAGALVLCSQLLPEHSSEALAVFRATLGAVGAGGINEAEVSSARASLQGALRERQATLPGLLEGWVDRLRLGLTSAQAAGEPLNTVTATLAGSLAARLCEPPTLQLVLAGPPKPAEAAVAQEGLGRPEIVRLTR